MPSHSSPSPETFGSEQTPILHWTYAPLKEGEKNLRQGDILCFDTSDLESFFGKGHIFCSPRYLAFMIITQDCDLVLRENERCDTDHINLVGIVSLETFLADLLELYGEKAYRTISPRIYSKRTRSNMEINLKKILNQNEWKIGLFYIHKETEIKIGEPSIALLRISSSLSYSKETYEELRKHRTGHLSDIFRAKLGWMVGHLYSRIATPDWGEYDKNDKEEMKKIIDQLLSSENICLFPKSWIMEARRKNVNLESLSPEKIVTTLENNKPRPFYEEVTDYISNLISSKFNVSEADIENFKKELNQDQFIKSITNKKEIKEE